MEQTRWKELLGALRDGDTARMDEIFRLTHQHVYGYAKIILAERTAVLEVMRDFYLSLVDALALWDGKDDGWKLMDRALFNQCKRLLQRRAPERFELGAEDMAQAERFAAEGAPRPADAKREKGDSSDGEPTKAAKEALRKWLLSLQGEERLFFILYYANRMDVADIATLLRVPAELVAARIYSAATAARQFAESYWSRDPGLQKRKPSDEAALTAFLLLLADQRRRARLQEDAAAALLADVRGAIPAPAARRRAVTAEELESDPATEPERVEHGRFNQRTLIKAGAAAGATALALLLFFILRPVVARWFEPPPPTTDNSFQFGSFPSGGDDFPVIIQPINPTTTVPFTFPGWPPALPSAATNAPQTEKPTTNAPPQTTIPSTTAPAPTEEPGTAAPTTAPPPPVTTSNPYIMTFTHPTTTAKPPTEAPTDPPPPTAEPETKIVH
ncbi:MAG: hypothetical protein LBJ11_01195 [Oscillospiraceae bacterium]|jgi:DNA-directed RNA polymerase specialized sigma24 family protein|nr:hypothetical protein [Oscillospiraceae bacterium]